MEGTKPVCFDFAEKPLNVLNIKESSIFGVRVKTPKNA